MLSSGKPSDKVIMISGANRGIGQSVVQLLDAESYSLSLGMRQAQPATNHLCCEYHASNLDSVQNWVDTTLDHFGRIDAVVHCAGILRLASLEDDIAQSEAALKDMLDVNVMGAWYLAQSTLPALKKSGAGRFIQIVSLSGKRVKGASCAYPVSKFAQMAITQCVRNSGWDAGVRSTAICPSWVNTEMIEDVCPLPADQVTQPQSIADAVSMLLKLPNEAAINELQINCGLEPLT